MSANTDKFKRLARKWVGSIGAGGVADGTVTTIPLSSSSGLPTDTAVVATIDRVDVNGVATPSLEESVVGVVSGNNLVTCTRGAEGTAQAHSAGAVVEILFTNKVWGDLIDGILEEHNQFGHTNTGGWIEADETWTYASATTFTISGDKTSKYQKGDKIKLTNSTVKYFYIIGVSYSDPNTTVTVTGGSDYALASGAITDNYYSKAENPQGFPNYFKYTPSYGALGSMTFTRTGAQEERFFIKSNTCFLELIGVQGTTAGTASTIITVTLPVASAHIRIGQGIWVYDVISMAGAVYQEAGDSSLLRVYRYDGSAWGIGANKFFTVVMNYKF